MNRGYALKTELYTILQGINMAMKFQIIKLQKNLFFTEFPSRKACNIAVQLGVISKDLANKISRRGKEYRSLSFKYKLRLLRIWQIQKEVK